MLSITIESYMVSNVAQYVSGYKKYSMVARTTESAQVDEKSRV